VEAVTKFYGQRDILSGSEAWWYRVGEGAFISAIGEGTVVVAAHYGRIAALDLATGAERWRLALPPLASALRGTISAGRLYVGVSFPGNASTEAPAVYAVDLATGRLVWEATLDEGTDLDWAPPVMGNGVVYVADTPSHPGSAPTSHLHALDAASGVHRWKADLHDDFASFHQIRPLVAGDTVYVVGSGALLAIEAATGRERWALRSTGGLPQPAGLVHGQLLVALGDRVSGLNPTDGRELWSVPSAARWGPGGASPVLAGDVLYVVEAARTMAIALPSGRVVWEVAVESVQEPALAAGALYVAGRRELVALDIGTGRPRWAAAVEGQPGSSVGVTGEHVIVAAADGTVVAVGR